MHKIYRIQKRKLYKIYVCNVTLKMKLLKYSCNSFFSIQITAQERLRVRERERERVGQQVKFIFKRSCSCSLNNTSTYRKRPARDESASEQQKRKRKRIPWLPFAILAGNRCVCVWVNRTESWLWSAFGDDSDNNETTVNNLARQSPFRCWLKVLPTNAHKNGKRIGSDRPDTWFLAGLLYPWKASFYMLPIWQMQFFVYF